jgi:M6 family metalloprotease-like protein
VGVALARALSAGLLLAASFLAAAPAHAVVPPAQGGPLPKEVRDAIAAGTVRPAAPHVVNGKGPSVEFAPTNGRWNVPVLLVDFPDRHATYAPSLFSTMLFDTSGGMPTGSVADYYKEISNDALKLRGQVYGWKTLPDTVNFYANDSYGLSRLSYPQNDAGMMNAALKLFDPEIDFSKYDKDNDGYVDCVFLVHADMGAEGAAGDRRRFWSVTSPFSNAWGFVGAYITDDPWPGHPGQFEKIDQFSILPEKSAVELNQFTEIGVYCHEFGHDLGLPDLYDTSSLGGASNLGPGNWCLMSTGAYGPNNRTPARPTHMCAWSLADLGWVTVQNLTTNGDTNFDPIETSRTAYRLWYQGESSAESFLLENRQPIGFDAGLPGHGLLISRIQSDLIATRRALNTVNSGAPPGLRVEEADGHYDLMNTFNRGDSHDPFPGTFARTRFADDTTPSTTTYAGRPLNTSLEAIRESNGEITAYVQLLPQGWSPPVELGAVGDGATLVGNGAQALIGDPTDDLWLALADDASGRPEVDVWRKRFGVAWSGPTAMTNEPGLSESPVLALASNGNKALVWWDTRDGNSEIYYAWAPAGGAFGAARRITNQAAFSQLPVATFKANGQLVVVWTDGRDGGSTLYSRTFLPGQEAGAADVRVSFPQGFATQSNSAAPSVVAVGNRVVIAFTERISGVDEIEAVTDSAGAWTQQRELSQTDGFTSNQPTVAAIDANTAWVIWRDNLSSTNILRAATWSIATGWAMSPDTPYQSPETLDSPHVLVDAFGDTHLLFRRTNGSGVNELVESIRHHGIGAWDWGPALLQTFDAEQLGGAAYAMDAVGRTHVIWLADGPNGQRLREIVRAAPASAPVGVVPAPDNGVALVRATPDPARTNVAFDYDTPAARPRGTQLELVNVAGRRVAHYDAAGAGPGRFTWSGIGAGGERVAPGVVFVRVVSPDGATLARGRFVWLP